MKSFEDAVKYQLNVREVANKWYLRFNTEVLEEKEIREFLKDVEIYKVDADDVHIVMKDFYINYLEKLLQDNNIEIK